MKRPTALIAALTVVGGVAFAGSAQAALSQVRLGNFYYEDATVGDGKLEIRQGDQLRFIVEDNGPGTPHSVEVDALGIHSGGLSTGDTYTTPPIQQAGSFKLYCRLHENRGHVTTLVVLAGTTATTTTTAAPPTTAAPAPPTTASGSSTPTTAPSAPAPGDSPAVAGTGETATTAPPDATGSTTDSTAADSTAADSATATPTADTTDTTLASGLGQASDEDLDALPVDPDSLEAVLGRLASTRGPWTRSVRMALLGAIPLLAAAAIALARFAQAPGLAPSIDPASPHDRVRHAHDDISGAGRARPLRVDPDAMDTV